MMRLAFILLYLASIVLGQSIPEIPGEFRVSEEMTSNGKTTYIKDVIYSDKHQVIRYERRASKPDDPLSFYQTDPLISIHDYNVGVSFTINKVLLNCSISSISIATFDLNSNFSNELLNVEENYVYRLKSPKAFFQLDTDYTFEAADKIEGIPANTFNSEFKKNISNVWVNFKNNFAFSSNDIQFQQTFSKAKNIPLRLKTLEENKPESASFFFNYDVVEDLRWFEVSQCFNDVEEPGSIDFLIKFEPLGTSLPDEKTLVNSAIEALTKYTLESFTRFTIPTLGISEEGNLYLRARILPPPPPLAYFTTLKNFWLLSSPAAETTRSANNTVECAQRCLANLKCLSFDYSFNTKSCYINTRHSVDTVASSITNITHHSRNTLNGFYSRAAFDIMSLLTQGAENGSLTINVNDKVLKAISVQEVEDFLNARYGTTQLLSRYDLKLANRRFAKGQDKTLKNTNIDDCVNSCNNELEFDCQSFDFCYITGDCHLSKSEVSSNMEEYYSTSECDIYEKNALYHYTQYPSKAFTDEKDKNYENVNSPSECARKCDSEDSIHCRSFNYCSDLKKCFLSEKHVIDSNENTNTNPDLACTHYSRDYLADFEFTSSATIPLVGDVVYDGTKSLEECTFLCVSADGINCKSIDFCPETKKCLLHSGTAKPSSGNVPKDLCYNYNRAYYFTEVTITKSQVKDNSDVLFGVSISLGIVALIISASGLFLYMKKNSKL